MKNLLKAALLISLALVATLSVPGQTVAMNGIGSSSIFYELGLAASNSTAATPTGLGAVCLWTGYGASATDVTGGTSLTDSGIAFVAWEKGTGSCSMPSAGYKIYAYLQTDSVVGNRCLFHGSACTITYPITTPTHTGDIAPGEMSLPFAIATILNGAPVDTAGSDIRPEDAVFANVRAMTACNVPVVPGSQYLGLGLGANQSSTPPISSGRVNVSSFTLPANYVATPLGAAPILVVTNSPGSLTGFNASTASHNISSSALAKFLDGTYSYTDQTASFSLTGLAATVLISEPLSGAYNVMEYNVPNTTFLQTSQDVGLTQPPSQINCPPREGGIATPGGGIRQRAMSSRDELSAILANRDGDTLGYGFWSVGNFAGFTAMAAPNAVYMTVDGVDPLYTAGHTYTGVIPTLAGDLANITLTNIANGSYPIWSSLRLVNASATPTAGVSALAAASQNFVPTGVLGSRPDYVAANNLAVVHSHFVPPGQSLTPANGHGPILGSACTAIEHGGDVGGQIIPYTVDSRFCATHGNPDGQTGLRK